MKFRCNHCTTKPYMVSTTNYDAGIRQVEAHIRQDHPELQGTVDVQDVTLKMRLT